VANAVALAWKLISHLLVRCVMAVKRTRPTSSRRRVKRRAAPMARRPRAAPKNQLSIARTFFHQTWAFGTASTVDFWRYFIHKPADVPNWAEYSAVFDEYRLNAVKVTFRPRYDSVDSASSVPMYNVHTIVDPASTVIPSGIYGAGSLNTLLENSGVRTRSSTKPFSVYYKPKMAIAVFGGATNVDQVRPTYLKTNDTSVDYRGFHMYIQGNNFYTGASNVFFDIFYTYYVTFRNTK